MQGVAHDTVMGLLTGQAETRIVWRPVHDEREGDALAPLAAVVDTYPDIVMRVGFATLVDRIENGHRIPDVKHWQSPHFPVGVARMGIVGKFYVDGPVVVQTVLYLHTDFVVGQRRQEGKGSL